MCARETVCACVCILSVSLKREPKPWQWLKLEAKIGIPPQPKTLTHTALYKPSKKWTKLFSTVPCEHYLLGYISSKICLFLLHKSPWKVLSSGWESMPRDTCSYSYMNVCINVYVFIYICNYVILAVNHESLCWFESFHSVQFKDSDCVVCSLCFSNSNFKYVQYVLCFKSLLVWQKENNVNYSWNDWLIWQKMNCQLITDNQLIL